ncbi:hypothetical protein SALINJAH_254 [Bacillus phage SalinJah]|uniref:Uncharacterized protein n=1 Tax=Bacillus phage SalinJah TaxID=1837830 RepID=A0A173GC19_9CAUD|nr:hypothetical protein SALINJAH_254 [Bacillus phage SalinJah]ANH50810.1 hypothetical protein SALINJAH_254 [Bacillus phage SalinJah]
MTTPETLQEQREELQDKLEFLMDAFDAADTWEERQALKSMIKQAEQGITSISDKLEMLHDNIDESAWYSSSDARLYETGLTQDDFIN